MILILSEDTDPHVTYVTPLLEASGAEYLWFDPARFPADAEILLSFDQPGRVRTVLRYGGRDVDLSRVTAVWSRRPKPPVPAPEITGDRQRRWVTREGQELLTGMWQSLDCLWVPGKRRDSDMGYNKPHHLALAARLGFHVPRTLMTNSPDAFLKFYAECEGRIVAKVMLDPRVWRDEEEHVFFTQVIRRRDMISYRAIRYAPVIVQEYIPKQVELRITVVGARVFTAEIHSQASRATRHDWRHYDIDRTPHRPHRLPPDIEALCLTLVQALGLCFGAIDMILTPEGKYVFVEINSNGQWAWIQDLTGLPIAEAIADLLVAGASAANRGEAHVARA